MTDWKDKNVAILGFGIEGMSSSRYLTSLGAKLTIRDKRTEEELDTQQKAVLEEIGASYSGGEGYLSGLDQYDVIVRSPGISFFAQEFADAKKKGVEITSQTKIFMDLCPCPIIGVTGTKGKGTTASLIYEMMKASSKDLITGSDGVFLAGNIGTPPLDLLPKLSEKSLVVLELSSFQLEDVTKSPHIAVMLMVMPEHLDHHADMLEYVTAKRNILQFQTKDDFAVINRDYIASHESDIYTEGKVYHVTRERTTMEQGAFVKDGALWMRMMEIEWKVIDLDEIALLGKHNWENAAAAAMTATLAGASKADIERVLRTFKGLPHRLELVSEKNGVAYYDDSFSTTPETAIAAIEAFTRPQIVILGGSSKHSDFTSLAEAISTNKHIKAIIGIGEEWARIKQAIEEVYTKDPVVEQPVVDEFDELEKEEHVTETVPTKRIPPLMLEGAKDMQTVVTAAAKLASEGDVVLLSPACASFGMFKDYKERGDLFKSAVLKL